MGISLLRVSLQRLQAPATLDFVHRPANACVLAPGFETSKASPDIPCLDHPTSSFHPEKEGFQQKPLGKKKRKIVSAPTDSVVSLFAVININAQDIKCFCVIRATFRKETGCSILGNLWSHWHPL